jgi:hypothetical protein
VGEVDETSIKIIIALFSLSQIFFTAAATIALLSKIPEINACALDGW